MMNFFQDSLRIKIIILVLFICNVSYGQVYTFDKLVTHKFSTQSFPNQESTKLFNSKDYSYYMQVFSRNDSIKARIFDTKKLLVHYYFIDESKSFWYLQTVNMPEHSKDYTFDFSETKIKRNREKVIFKVFNQNKKRIARYRLTIKKTEQNLFTVFKLSAFETFQFTKIVAPFNFVVLKAKGRNEHGNSIKYELKSIEDIDVTFTIP